MKSTEKQEERNSIDKDEGESKEIEDTNKEEDKEESKVEEKD